MGFDPALGSEPFAYLTTTGRRSGLPREIEIWFVLSDDGASVHVLAGAPDRARWLANARADPAVRVRIGGEERAGRAEVPEPGGAEDAAARAALVAKYGPGHGGDLRPWARRGGLLAIRVAAG
jgi:deazaflavin-dependent oxidoreductase (nitroreductase family)